jgi:hypothetical protein
MKTNILVIIAMFFSFSALAQNQPVLAIDGVNTTFQSGLSLPYWLKAGQTLNVVANASSVSIMEFTEDTTTLKYSRVISLNSLQTVPSGKIWKIEAIGIATIGTVGFSSTSMPTIFTSPKIFNSAGTYSWTVPPNVTSICVEVWGGGGSGGTGGYTSGSNPNTGGGGGGGGYGYQCFLVVPGNTYSVTVGGASGTSSLGTLISASGGVAGGNATSTVSGLGGSGGTSAASFNLSGANGSAGTWGNSGGVGGAGANGGVGGAVFNQGAGSGTSPGGGGGGGNGYTLSVNNGGGGAPGKVIIYW